MICKIVCSTLLVFIFIQIIVEARVPLKNLHEQHEDFLTENKNKTILELRNVFSHAVSLFDMKLNTLNMSQEVLSQCAHIYMTGLMDLFIEYRTKLNDCVELALDHIDRSSIKYWQYEERRRQFMICVEKLSDNFNTSSISLITTNFNVAINKNK